MNLKSLTPAIALVIAAAAQAQSGAASAPPSSPAKKDLAQKILKQQQSSIENMAAALAEAPARQLMQQAGVALQQVPADKREAVARALQADAKKYVDEASPLMKSKAVAIAQQSLPAVLESKFTEAELRQVLAWLESPTSRKFGEVGGEMSQTLREQLVAEMRPSIDGKIKALQASMEKDLQSAVPSSAAPAAPAASATKKK